MATDNQEVKNKKKIGFKSLFTKLFVIYLGVIGMSFAIMSIVLPKVLETYYIEQKEKLMITQGEKIARQLGVAYYMNAISLSRIKEEFELLSSYVNIDAVWLISKDGVIVGYEQENLSTVTLQSQDIEALFNGETIVVQNRFNDIFLEPTLTIGCPVWFNDKPVYGLMIHTSIPELQESIRGVYDVFIFCILISASIAFVFIYFFSKKITKPLKDMNDVAKIISSGNFNKRIQIESQDEIGQLAISFNEMADGLDKLEEYRSKFIANISHDLRSPITSIQGFLNAILDGTIPEEKQEKYLRIALDETNRLTKLTNDILELSKMENQEITLNLENFDINEMIRNIISSFEARIIEKGIKINVRLIAEGTWVYADAQKMERVIYNLLDNAVKFTEEGSISIEVTQEADKIFISIADTGIGLTKEEAKHIFDRFYKADTSRGIDKKGMGLGLSIVKEIIKAHNENISVSSEKNSGTVFKFSLQKSDEI